MNCHLIFLPVYADAYIPVCLCCICVYIACVRVCAFLFHMDLCGLI